MARSACVDIPFFSLQVLFREQPEWKGLPSAVVDRDKATGKILSVNEAARAKGVRPGLSYRQALSLVGDLRAARVGTELLDAARKEIIELLYAFTPEVEPCRPGRRNGDDLGTFRLNAAGLEMLYPSLSVWTTAALRSLDARGFSAVVAVGFTGFGSYIVARSRRKSIVLTSQEQEEHVMREAPVRVLPLSPEALALFRRLGIDTVGAFLDLPEWGVAKRFGREAKEIFRWAYREWLPVQPFPIQKNARVVRRFDDPVTNLIILTASVDELLDELLLMVRAKQKLIGAVTLELFEGTKQCAREEIRPAVPTGEAPVLKTLSRLRLSELGYKGTVDRVEVSAEEIVPIERNGDLFASARRQAMEAGKRAFAVIRARFGNDAVRHAVLHDEHLPEKRYTWEAVVNPIFPTSPVSLQAGPLQAESAQGVSTVPTHVGPEVKPAQNGPLKAGRPFRVVRRLFEGTAPVGPLLKSLRLVAGPFVYTGKWWLTEERREYYLARGPRGGLLWIYREDRTGNWRFQGMAD